MSAHVLILGGHGQVAQLLTPLLLRRSWTVTSLIRAPEQVPAIEKLGSGLPGKLQVVVRSIDAVDSSERAGAILDEVKPQYVVWSAGEPSDVGHPVKRHRASRGVDADHQIGAGGKGGPEMVMTFRNPACVCRGH